MPDAIQDAPRLMPGLALFYDAFFELHTCRSAGMSQGPIPWLAINTYANDLEIGGDQREDLYYHIREMDDAFLKHSESKSGS